MKTQYYAAASLDGFIADPHHSLDWLFQFGPAEGDTYPDFIKDVGALAMGSATYEWLLRHHILPDAPAPMAWPYTQPTWVFTSRALTRIVNADVRFVHGDVRPVHEEMRAAAGDQNIWIVGGGELAGLFYDAGLLDEIQVTVTSVTLGAGAPLLPRRIITPPLQLRSVKQQGSAFAHLVYDVPRIDVPKPPAHENSNA